MSNARLYRGKREDNGEWVYGWYRYDSYYDLHQICYIKEMPRLETGHIWENPVVGPATVGQSTGLCDKNGKEIYEGDIVEYIQTAGFDAEEDYLTSEENRKYKNKVVFRDGAFYPRPSASLPDDGYYAWRNWGFEIIGNIHDNPELLEQQ